jgi:predicted nuclease with RNAse H fold
MKIIGIDLSGPANHKDTVMAIFEKTNEGLVFEDMILNASDEMIISAVKLAALVGEVAIGIDAPLSYQDGGGDRPQDKSLRQFIKGYGLSGSSIMPPTLTKMVYLTLRGMGLTRRIMAIPSKNKIRIVEVHPGAAIGTRIGQDRVYHALHYKKEAASGKAILEWFETVGIHGLPLQQFEHSHQIDACAAALAVWHWTDITKKSKWHWDKTSEEHPFEVYC